MTDLIRNGKILHWGISEAIEEHLRRAHEVLDKIFVPFFTTKSTGSGIGLSLCKQIMNLHGGSISASSEIGKGSCFTLKFLCCG